MKEFIGKSNYRKAFFIGFVTAFCIFLPFMVVDKGFFLYAGDFNSQQIPFYMYMNRMVKSGNLNWGWAVDMGSPLVTSFSFYLLGSPFFWLSCVFPYKAVPYIMPWLLMLKFRVGNLGAFIYLKRYAKSENYALLGALLYTFSGFSIYNIFFNHFIESVVFFPYLLWALDEYMYEGRKGIFPLFVALNFVNNYFFFMGQVVFLFIYFFCKVNTKEYIIDKKHFAGLCFESLLGCFMGIILFIPSLFSICRNPRVFRGLKDFGLWMYKDAQQYFAILTSALLPPDIPYSPAIYSSGILKWTSMSRFVAMGGLFGFFVFNKHRRNSGFYKTFVVCVICAFVPALNSMFYRFNSSYYARWFYMPVLMLVAMNMQSFETDKTWIFRGLKTTALLTACLTIFGLTPGKTEEGVFRMGITNIPAVYRLQLLVAFLSLYTVYIIVDKFSGTKVYTRSLIYGSLFVIFLFSFLHIGVTKMPQWERDKKYKGQNYDIIDTMDFSFGEEKFNGRIDTFNCYDNLGLYLNTGCIQAFNSTVSPSIMEFYPNVGVKRDVSSKPDRALYPLRSLLSVKYILAPEHEENNFVRRTKNRNYEKVTDKSPYVIYRNKNYIPMGFCYDKYITYETLETVNTANRSNILLRRIAVEKEIINKYNIDLQPLKNNNDLFDYTYTAFEKDVSERNTMASYDFCMTNRGFSCKIDMAKNNLVFFSVPYEKGFKAFVNGKEAEVIKVNYGLCAVYAPKGDNHIEFVYRTPGLTAGIVLTVISRIIWVGYICMSKRKEEIK